MKMTRQIVMLTGIILVGLALRLFLLLMIDNPGMHDSNHYYNLGRRLHQGQGFTIDYVWMYSHLPEQIVHPIDHWMPLAGVTVALGMAIGGQTPTAALMPFITASLILPVLVYLAAKQLALRDDSALIAAAFALVLPDIVWNALRTDTTILNMVFISASLIALTHGIQHGKRWALLLAGVGGGLAYLTRNDSLIILPLVLVLVLGYRLLAPKRCYPARALWSVPLAFVLTISPWLVRNQLVLGMLGSAETSRMFFMVDQRDHYAYATEITLQTMLEQRTISELLGKRLFELLAAGKQVLTTLDVVLPVLVVLGALWIIWHRERDRLLVIAPVMIWIGGILVAYPLLMPYKSQSGSFEKAYLTVVPLLLPLAALALEKLIHDTRWRIMTAAIALMLMMANSYDLVRQETAFINAYYANIEQLIAELETLPDLTGDQELRLMSQDPYVLSYYGYASIMTPLATRDQTLDLARRYEIDYMLMPAARPALDALYQAGARDPRFERVRVIERNDGRTFELYAIVQN